MSNINIGETKNSVFIRNKNEKEIPQSNSKSFFHKSILLGD